MPKLFTSEEVHLLQQNPNVQRITESQIKFTSEFKEEAFQQLQAGKPMREIFRENGVDPEILGDTRVYSFTKNLKEKASTDLKFSDKRQYNGYKRPVANALEEKVRLLEHQVAYMSQEIEFLKKNLEADMEARRRWESQHLHI